MHRVSTIFCFLMYLFVGSQTAFNKPFHFFGWRKKCTRVHFLSTLQIRPAAKCRLMFCSFLPAKKSHSLYLLIFDIISFFVPFKFWCVTGRRARLLIASAWIISVIFSSPIIFLYEEKIIQGKNEMYNN